MAYVIGIDTGGTYTDTVLLKTEKRGPEAIVKRAKALTTHDCLEEGIKNSLKALNLNSSEADGAERIVLSTTLATNAIVERKLCSTGLIIVGDAPRGQLAADYTEQVPGKMNIKGRVLVNVSREATLKALERIAPHVEALAVSGGASVRNPAQEKQVREIIRESSSLPVICGHEMASSLGYLERTNTAVVNAGLLPIIDRFMAAVKKSLKAMGIQAPIFVVKGDGSIATEEFIREKPVETALSGPAASMIGTISLTGLENITVSDMGGTTTDIGIVRNRRVELSEKGADIGGWSLRIKSARLRTIGLGGDSAVIKRGENIKIGPERVLPVCRGGEAGLTPTDILHCTGEFTRWDRELSLDAAGREAAAAGMETAEYVGLLEEAVAGKIYREIIEPCSRTGLPVCAIGAPAEAWYGKVKDKYEFDLKIPRYYEVANAVGAAAAGICQVSEAVVRKGEEGRGYLVHTEEGRYFFADIKEAVEKGISVSKERAEGLVRKQKLEPDRIEAEYTEAYMEDGRLRHRKTEWVITEESKEAVYENTEDDFDKFVEIRIKVRAIGKSFV
ncbi:MAG TPA: hydantoinase/oxoprolinase family protein [Candidatus Copromorpha excrementigallinarum]|uniref:Hydantoinase/oxoprolinase family protein n=1 Tax=Candidatus Allocopromorpha excrementigallinarum TaxID=2840742 RepID=A0A9D1L697_9FIRM|nr:hydantoinase/oxoprolinase family protein [Candidatus Copromorpha excrementigallinarum]